ncbi:MAG: hypothetical protein RSC33_03795 [Vagococcus sp.]
MMNKKLVGTTLVGLMALGFAGQAFAAQTNNGDGTSNVNGENKGEMKVRGSLGKENNTDPDAPIEEGSDKWINVTFPTATIFNSDDAETITSPSYTITNNSARDVQVDVAEYVLDGGDGVAALKELNLENNQGIIKLAENGATAISGNEKAGVIDRKGESKFHFNGLVDKDALGADAKGNVESHVVFEFKALKDFTAGK